MTSRLSCIFGPLAAILSLCLVEPARALDRIVLKNGLELFGDVEVQASRISVRSGPRVFHFSSRQLLTSEAADASRLPERFSIPQNVNDRGPEAENLPEIVKVTEFDSFGRRTVITRGPMNKEFPTYQAITEIYPTHVVLRATNRNWQTTMPLSRLTTQQLDPIIRHGLDFQSSTDRLRWIHFLIQAERYTDAQAAIAKYHEEFPEFETQLELVIESLREQLSAHAVDITRRAVNTGQLAQATELLEKFAAQNFKESARAALADLQKKLDEDRQNISKAIETLRTARRAVAEHPRGELLDQAVEEITASISATTLPRLANLLALMMEPSTTNEEKLALALSGWTVGSEFAIKDLDRATNQWKQRELFIETRDTSDEAKVEQNIDLLKELGATANALLPMLPLLPAPPVDISSEEVEQREIEVREIGKRSYHVCLPPAYDRYREYPTVVVLHGMNVTPEATLSLWRPLAREHGFILIAPEFLTESNRPFGYSVDEHVAFLEMISDARRNFAMDADRVFLAGHDLGAFACWDFGMSHPDQFAGLVPICGVPQFYCKHYWPNLANLPVYYVEGTLNGGNLVAAQQQFNRYLVQGYDTLFVEYPGRGREPQAEELPTIFSWMSRLTRNVHPRSIEAVTARLSDRRFYWLVADGFMPNATVAPELFQRSKFRPARLIGKIEDNNSIQINPNGLTSLSILLSPGLVHLDDPKLSIRVHRKTVHQGIVVPELETLIREYRRSGDRKNPVVRIIASGKI
ncbi:MAG: hypothetical protein U1D30_21290 [Planctomycetota bacterium]